MPLSRVTYAEGNTAQAARGEIFQGVSPQYQTFEAETRVEAYIAAYQHFTAKGYDVTVLGRGEGEGRPLGFSPHEIEAISRAGIPLTIGLPKQGVRIEEVLRQVE